MRHHFLRQAAGRGGIETDDARHREEDIEKQDKVIKKAIDSIQKQEVGNKSADESECQPVSPYMMHRA